MSNKIKILFAISLTIFIISVILHFTKGIGYEIFGNIKPITIGQYSGFVLFITSLNLTKPFFSNFYKRNKEILLILGFLLILGTLFEMLWTFQYWFATYQLNVMEGIEEGSDTLDTLSYIPTKYQWYNKDSEFSENIKNLNISAKMTTLYFMMSVYFVWFLCSKN